MFLIFNTQTEKYYHSDILPDPCYTEDCDVIDITNKKCLSGPSGEHDITPFPVEDEIDTETFPEEPAYDPLIDENSNEIGKN